MRICVAQTKPVKGDIKANIGEHVRLIILAALQGANIIIFPELSITGYEPALAKDLATTIDDSRFNYFQELSDNHHITIGVGMPVQNDKGILIGLIIFKPHKQRDAYFKQHLHEDELPYFIGGPCKAPLMKDNIALAICYELSVPEHAAGAHKDGATIYIASVAKSVTGVEKAAETLMAIAKKYSMIVLMSNCVGHCDNFDCGGNTSVWNDTGALAAQLNGTGEGILMIDTDTQEITGNFI